MVLANTTTSYPQKLLMSMNINNDSFSSYSSATTWYNSNSNFYAYINGGYIYNLNNGMIFTMSKDFEFEVLEDSSKSLQFSSIRGTVYEATADVFKGYGNIDEGNQEIMEFVKLRIKAPNVRSLYSTLRTRLDNSYWAKEDWIS